MLTSTQKRAVHSRIDVSLLESKPCECFNISVARSSISSSPQSPDTCVMLREYASQPESPDCTKRVIKLIIVLLFLNLRKLYPTFTFSRTGYKSD